ncbi:MAG: hypothetical protein P9L92_19400, partial [Candidatus Electryonea clarkiae]|nr:hypothetical protein [Candidatus Electryonea clarkiae]
LQYSTPKVIIGAIAAGMRIVQKIWTIRIEKLDEKGTREISGLGFLNTLTLTGCTNFRTI